MSDIDHLVPDPAFIKEFGVTLMTLWRWDRDPRMIALGLPPPIKIRRRNHRNNVAWAENIARRDVGMKPQ